MKLSRFFLTSSLALFVWMAWTPMSLAQTPDFRTTYKQLDSLPNLGKMMYQVVSRPQWVGNDSLLYALATRQGTQDFVVEAKSGRMTPFTGERPRRRYGYGAMGAYPRLPRADTLYAPDSLWMAYVKDANVWVEATKAGTPTQVSFDGAQNAAYTRLYWSPDSKKIAAIQQLDAPMHRIPLLESSPKTQKQPILQWRDYYKPGDVMPVNKPALFVLGTSDAWQQVPLDTKPYEHQFNLFFRKWSQDGRAFYFDFNERGHQRYCIVRTDAQTGQTKEVVNEQFSTFVHYDRNFIQFIDRDKYFIWSSERDGWRHLYKIEAETGAVVQQLTKGPWVVREVLEVNPREDYILFMGNGRGAATEDPYNRHYYRMRMDGSKLIDLTPEPANHTAVFSPDNKTFLDTYSRPDCPPVSVLRSAKDGRIIASLAQADIQELTPDKWTMPQVFSAKGRDGVTDIWGTIFRPSHFDPTRKYPVVEYIYAGPHDAHVVKDFMVYARFQKLLELGCIVVTIDGMGTANRSKAFHDVCWRNLKDAGFPDRILWMQAAAAQYPELDIARGVGIYGYSAGGQNALSALLFYGDFYTTAVALCGCHDNRMDKVWWNEQWMGYPIGPWYAESSNVDNAWRMNGHLLLINGELDDNVDPASTLQVVDALLKADKDFEQLYLPGHSHNLGSDYITRRTFEFLTRWLQPSEQ